jgi:hypothetical protein
MLLAIDGRWPLPEASMRGLLRDAGWPDAAGSAWFGSGVAQAARGPVAVDFASLDAGAARLADPSGALDPPAPGEVALNASWARAHGLVVGDAVTLRAATFPKPLVSSAFEMERIRTCDRTPTARVCFLPTQDNLTVLRVVVDPDAQDLAFIPEGAELGPGGLPAWWNGSLLGPVGERLDFRATLDGQARPTIAEWPGNVTPGEWQVRFRLESNRHEIDGGAAGIVRVREPGYTWFDDRLIGDPDGANQTRTLLSWGSQAEVPLRVARLVERGIPSAQALVSPRDARLLVGARAGEATGLVVNASRDALPALSDARNRSADGIAFSLRARPLSAAAADPAPQGGAILFRAPLDVDVATLPTVEGAAPPFLAAEMQMPVGEVATAESRPVPGLRVLAFAGPGDAPFAMTPGGRWTTGAVALENVTRSRTLVLSTPDWAPGGMLTTRLVFGDARAGRVVVAVESVQGGPAGVAWASASLVAGAGKPLGALVVLPLAPGADAATVAARAQAAWAPFGLAVEE